MDKYKTLEVLGHGSYGSVYKAEDKETGEFVAIKKMKKKYHNWEECKNLREVKSLNNLKHENIIKLKEMIREEDILNLVFEFMETNLYELMRSKSLRKFKEEEIKNIIFQVIKGLAHMHKYNFFHRDLKPENILVKSEKIIKLADFGLAREIRSIPPFTEYVSTRWYRAPECLLSSTNYNSPIDIWAIGTIMAELYSHKPLFPGNNNKDMLNKICSVIGSPTQNNWADGILLGKKIDFKFPSNSNNLNNLRSLIIDASEEAVDFMGIILKWDPNKRPTALELLSHSYLSSCYSSLVKEPDGYLNNNNPKSKDFEREYIKDKDRERNNSRIGSKKNANTPDVNKSIVNFYFLL